MIQAIIKELELRKDEINETVETIYFGGGTPSLLSVNELQLLISEIYRHYNVMDNPEITLEANPDDLSNEQINKLTNTNTITTMKEGTVKFFNNARGFGFIKVNDSDEQVFVHHSNLIDEIKEDDKVKFEVEKGDRGLRATNVSLV